MSRAPIQVSVAMPAYNAQDYVAEAVESVLAQDHCAFELVIVDDASRDRTWSILQKFKRHPRVRLYRHSVNRGTGTTRNRLVRLARGQYISPCDADDIMLPQNLSRLSQVLDRDRKVGAVYGDLLVLETDPVRGLLEAPKICRDTKDTGWDLIHNQVNHAGSMVRKSLMLEVGGYDTKVLSVDDWSLWLKLAEIAELRYLPGEVYYVWRRHSRGITRTDPNIARDVARIREAAIRRRYGLTVKLD